MQQVPTQGIANLLERWSFVILGEHIVEEANHMHYKREINYYNLSKIVYSFSTEMFMFYVSFQYYRTNSLHNMGKMCPSCHPTGQPNVVNPM